jgi:hypothetical protein
LAQWSFQDLIPITKEIPQWLIRIPFQVHIRDIGAAGHGFNDFGVRNLKPK